MERRASCHSRERALCVFAASIRPRNHHIRCLGLIGVVGLLAFVFSAISPEDDDIQQEAIEVHQPKQTFFVEFKAPPSIRGSRRASTTSLVIFFTRRFFARPLPTARAIVGGEELHSGTFGSQTVDRSPPNKRS
jgi:hypothetical protein